MIEATGAVSCDKGARLCGNAAKRLIRDRHEEGDYRQAMEMWMLFSKRLPRYVTEEYRPAMPGN